MKSLSDAEIIEHLVEVRGVRRRPMASWTMWRATELDPQEA
jgi:hypothetical protein